MKGRCSVTSPNASVIGKQTPALRVTPERVDHSFGDLAIELCAGYGLEADDWQKLVLTDWLGMADDRWSALVCGLSVPRQNGKNVALEMRELFGMIGHGEKILHTAHELKTALKHFERFKYFFGNKVNDPGARFPELNALVTRLRNGNGQQSIFLENGGQLEISARTSGSGRGFTVDVLVCDEAQHLDDNDIEALLSTTSAAPLGNPQTIFTGTPPGPNQGEVFARTRAEVLDQKTRSHSWLEWAAAPESDLDDPQAWAEANPGLGVRVLHHVVEGERSAYSDEGFARERLGMWSASSSMHVIRPDVWAGQGDQLSEASDHVAVAIDVAPDRGVSSIATAGQRADGAWHVELIEQKSGTAWVVPYIVRLLKANPQIRAVVVDSASQSASMIDDLEKVKIKPTKAWPKDMAVACARFFDGVIDGTLFHTAQPQLTYALSVARKRSLLGGDAWGWNRKTADADITPVVAATLAVWGAQATAVTNPSIRSREPAKMIVFS